jgi:hypothetical protein
MVSTCSSIANIAQDPIQEMNNTIQECTKIYKNIPVYLDMLAKLERPPELLEYI